MKKVLLITTLIFLCACRKDHSNNATNALFGSWEYRGTACYCAAAADTVSNKPGNGNILKFSEGTYQHLQNGVIIKSGSYVIVKDSTSSAGITQQVNRIIYDNDTTSAKVFFSITGNKLTLFGTTPLAADGPEEYYERL